MDPITVTLGSGDIYLLNRAGLGEMQQLAADYLAGDPIPPVVVATYKGRQLAVNGSHRLSALARLVQNRALNPADASSDRYVLTLDGDAVAQADLKCREALDFVEACCLNPVEPQFLSLDDAGRGEKLRQAIRTLMGCSSNKDIKESLRSDAGGGYWGM